jgi:hypothetical protein
MFQKLLGYMIGALTLVVLCVRSLFAFGEYRRYRRISRM